MNIFTIQQQFPDDEICLALLEQQRWGKDGENRYCSHCGVTKTYSFSNGKLVLEET
jgi:hypothetical protein